MGRWLADHRYWPYGEKKRSDGASTSFPTDRLFTGMAFYDTMGLYHMGARHYDPELGRWISPDTLVPDPSNPQSLNRFSYAYNNPLRLVDPSGQTPEEACSASDEECTDDEIYWYVEYCLNNPNSSGCEPTATPFEAAGWFVVGVGGAYAVVGLVEATGGFALRFLGLASADGDPTNEAKAAIRALEDVAYDASMRAGEGATDRFGKITISPHGSLLDRLQALYHEQAHRFFTPSGFLEGPRTAFRMWAYNHSDLVKYTEEAIAESYAQWQTGGPAVQGLWFPISQGYVNPVKLTAEAGALAVAVDCAVDKVKALFAK
ncbi:MAG: RHS repeat-associated core domain-containing protein [Anaerolineae bacterium]